MCPILANFAAFWSLKPEAAVYFNSHMMRCHILLILSFKSSSFLSCLFLLHYLGLASIFCPVNNDSSFLTGLSVAGLLPPDLSNQEELSEGWI